MKLTDYRLEPSEEGGPSLYSRIERMIDRLLAVGKLSDGDRLPSVRDLAQHLSVNALTVSKAYRELARRGIVTGRGRGGTVIARSSQALASTTHRIASAEVLDRSPRQELTSDSRMFQSMLSASRSPDVIALTKAYSSADIVWANGISAVTERVLGQVKPATLSYSDPSGSPELRCEIARFLAAQGLQCSPDAIVVSNGAQHALDMVSRTVLSPGDFILMERPSYFGMLDLVRSMRVVPVGVDLEADGLSLQGLHEGIERYRPKALYIMPNFQNPSGVTLSAAKRQQVVGMCASSGVAIIEDDYAPEMRFSGRPLQSLFSIAATIRHAPDVFYIRSLNKSYMPGIRIGFVVSPTAALDRVVASRSVSDLHSSNLSQLFATEFLKFLDVDIRIAEQIKHYASMQDVLFSALRESMPSAVEISRPCGGLNLWVKLPAGVDAGRMLYRAMMNRVSYFPGEVFYPDNPDRGTLRVSFGSGNAAELVEGAARLSNSVKDQISTSHGGYASVV